MPYIIFTFLYIFLHGLSDGMIFFSISHVEINLTFTHFFSSAQYVMLKYAMRSGMVIRKLRNGQGQMLVKIVILKPAMVQTTMFCFTV